MEELEVIVSVGSTQSPLLSSRSHVQGVPLITQNNTQTDTLPQRFSGGKYLQDVWPGQPQPFPQVGQLGTSFFLPPGHCLSSSLYDFYFTLPILYKVVINIPQHLICLIAPEVSLQDFLTPRKTVQNVKMLGHPLDKENQIKRGDYDSDSPPRSFSVSFLLALLLLKQSPYLSHLAQNSLINSD